MTRIILLFIIAVLSMGLWSCAGHRQVSPVRQDPLIGRIIEAQTGQQIDLDTLIDRISSFDVIYLSEKHDNAAQHRFQKQVIRKLLDKGLSPTLGFEFFAMDSTPDILNFIDSGAIPHTEKMQAAIEADLRKKLGWDTQSDTMWRYYFDLLVLARDSRIPAAGIDLPGTLKRRITRKGIENLSGLEKEQIFSTRLEDEKYKNYMFDIFRAVHCGMEHGNMQQRLYETWLARNDKMALSVTRLNHYKKGPVVIIIGGGHTEYRLGVMDRVAAIAPGIRQVNIALTEIFVQPSSLEDYLVPLELEGYPQNPPADFLVFFQRVSYENPCEKFRKQLKKMKPHPR